jgi:hypothetical protein
MTVVQLAHIASHGKVMTTVKQDGTVYSCGVTIRYIFGCYDRNASAAAIEYPY